LTPVKSLQPRDAFKLNQAVTSLKRTSAPVDGNEETHPTGLASEVRAEHALAAQPLARVATETPSAPQETSTPAQPPPAPMPTAKYDFGKRVAKLKFDGIEYETNQLESTERGVVLAHFKTDTIDVKARVTGIWGDLINKVTASPSEGTTPTAEPARMFRDRGKEAKDQKTRQEMAKKLKRLKVRSVSHPGAHAPLRATPTLAKKACEDRVADLGNDLPTIDSEAW